MKTLRELMIDQIKGYGWLSFGFVRHVNYDETLTHDKALYLKYLLSLNDEDLLDDYNDTRESIMNLD